jgi:basic membrane protein A and related proteins
MRSPSSLALLALCCAVALLACRKNEAPAPSGPRVGLVTDVGGRGDGSFNDSALRGLELWAGGKKYVGTRYVDASREELAQTLTEELARREPPIVPLGITPLVLQSKAQEDYEPNLQLLADQGATLVVGAGFMLENAIEAAAKQHPKTRFLLIDSPLLDAQGRPYSLPNVRTVVFREEEGAFLVGALAALVSTTGKVGFVGGMEIPLIKKFETGYRAGARKANPAIELLAAYTGSFDNVARGKQVAQDLIVKGADVVFHAAGSDGLGVIQAVREARRAGRQVYAIGVDSDQSHLAPEAVLTSMVKRVDLAVYQAAEDLVADRFDAGDQVLGLKEGAVGLAPVRVEVPNKQAVLDQVAALRTEIVEGRLQVPATLEQLARFQGAP